MGTNNEIIAVMIAGNRFDTRAKSKEGTAVERTPSPRKMGNALLFKLDISEGFGSSMAPKDKTTPPIT